MTSLTKPQPGDSRVADEPLRKSKFRGSQLMRPSTLVRDSAVATKSRTLSAGRFGQR